MRRLITLLIILGFAVWAGISIHKDPGYMLLAWEHWTLETPLWFGIILWLIFAFIIIFIATIWRSLSNLSAHWQAWRANQRHTRSNNLTLRSLLECIEGYYESAEKNVLKALPNAELPLVDYLIAAYCAHQLNEVALREDYFLNAKNVMPEAETALHLLKVQWLIQSNELSQAESELEVLLNEDPHQSKALLLAKDLYLKSAAWDKLLRITQTLKKRKLISTETYEDLQSKAYAAKLIQAAEEGDAKSLSACWITIPSNYQSFPELALVYAKALIRFRQGAQAEEVLKDTLKKFWDENLVHCYGLAVGDNTENQLKTAEKWLQDHENDPVLLLTLGKLCMRAQLWAKARSYLEASLTIQEAAETYLALAELTAGQGDLTKANDYYAKGLNLALN